MFDFRAKDIRTVGSITDALLTHIAGDSRLSGGGDLSKGFAFARHVENTPELKTALNTLASAVLAFYPVENEDEDGFARRPYARTAPGEAETN